MLRKLLAALSLCLLFAPAAQATHISGGDIYYTCLGGNQYKITLVVYRDCAGINLNASYNLDIASPCGNKTVTVTTPGGVEISQLCALELPNSTCNGGGLPGIQEYVYTGTVSLPPCNSWTISWSQQWRNGAIANLVNPGNKNVYVEAKINNLAGPCNDSPRFTNTAIPYVCAGYPVSYSYGAFDPEADSLTYTFISAMNSNAVALPYVSGFSGTQPITGITLNSATGLVNFTLNSIGNWVVVVLVDEYNANGVWIGSVMRDMQFIAYPCTNVPPSPASGTISGLTGDADQTGPRAIKVCESGDFCFDAVITDLNAGDSLRVTTNLQQNLPGATITFSGANPLTCHICWTAGPGSAGFYPFLINVNDGACPIPSEQSYVYAVRVKPGIAISPPSTTPETCAGDGDGTATVGITLGAAPFHYIWSTGDTTVAITAPAGNYTVIISDAIGCENGPIAVVIPPGGSPSTANAGADLVGCPGHLPIHLVGTVQNSSGGSWSGGAGNFSGSGLTVNYSPTPGEIASGGVDLVLTSAVNACGTGRDTVHVALPTSFNAASITATQPTCANSSTGTATFSPSNPAFTYLWSDPFTVQATATAINLGAGNYSVHVTDTYGCDTTLNTVITAPAAIAITGLTVSSENCAGAGDGTITALVTGGTAPYHYTWSNGDTTALIHVGAGTYTLSVTDANGCTPATGSANVQALGQPNVAHAGADLIGCFTHLPVQLNGAVINATGGAWSGGNGTFSNGGLTPTYLPTTAEINANAVELVLTTTGNTGCPAATDTVHLTLPTSFFGSGTTTQNVLCHGTATGSATFTPADPSFSFVWSAQASGQTTATATNLAAGNYTVHVTDAFGCDTTATVTVAEPPTLTVSASGSAPTCNGGANGTATVTVTGGTPGYGIVWGGNTGGQVSTTATGLQSGTYSATVTDSKGCVAQATATLLAPPAITLTAQVPDTVCVNAPVQLTAQSSGGTGVLSVVWAGIGTGNTIQHAFSASQNVQVTVTDQAGCSGPTLSLPVYVLNLQQATLNTYGDTAFCAGGTAALGAFVTGYPGTLTYTWPQLAASGTGPFHVTATHDSVLHVTVTDACANTLNGQVHIRVEIPPVVVLPDLIAEGCAPLTAHFPAGLANVPVNWNWNFGDGTTSTAMTPVHLYNAGEYTVSVTVTTPLGCTATSVNTGMVHSYSAPTAEFSASPFHTDADHPDVQFTDLSAGQPTAWNWQFGDNSTSNLQNPLHTFTSTGAFLAVLYVTNEHGCTSEISHTVQVDPIYDITIPNAFSPNPNGGSGGSYDPNDLSNDVFYPFIRFVKDFRMRVFNRWGELVFESDDIKRGWDGWYKGRPSQQDVYAYQVWVRFLDGKEITRLGDITLFR
ncbi:MAG: PKD domain-containing protein [Flavobacteriales bacterium]|nr:PKD domain-containing protein [Flavobacteriales bacterium]